jgi:uncharacterized RDD family membrane protein YckC
MTTVEEFSPLDPYDITGHYAGPLSRLIAAAIDWFGGVAAFGVFGAVIAFFLRMIGGGELSADNIHLFSTWLLFGLWMFAWYWIGTATTGKTIGKLIVGIRVVADDATALSRRRALVRVLVLPVSVLFFGLGLVGIVVGRRYRALHDVAAHSAVIYDWGDRRAEKPKMFLLR